jgi:nucleoside 2-deoxyribosyltransferase
MEIYLAGGMKSGWQDELISHFPNIEFLDPRSHGLTEPKDYTKWDLDAIRECDVIFGYLEESNPTGYNLCFELGYAHALGKKIIWVNENLDNKTSAVAMIEESADKVFDNFQDSLHCLIGKHK